MKVIHEPPTNCVLCTVYRQKISSISYFKLIFFSLILAGFVLFLKTLHECAAKHLSLLLACCFNFIIIFGRHSVPKWRREIKKNVVAFDFIEIVYCYRSDLNESRSPSSSLSPSLIDRYLQTVNEFKRHFQSLLLQTAQLVRNKAASSS